MADYRYIFGTLRDEVITAEIPCFGVYMDMELNKGGQLNASFGLDWSGFDNATFLEATIPGKSWVVVERNGYPIWSGFVWSRTYQSQAKLVQLFCQSWDNYPQYQRILTDFSMTGEQRGIFVTMWEEMMDVSGRYVNINLPTLPYSGGVNKTVEVLASDNKFYGEVMEQIADGDTGFDWYISTAKTGDQYVKTLVIGYPTLGINIYAPIILTFEYPGAITNYYYTESMAEAGTHFRVVGAGEGDDMLTQDRSHTDLITAGWPRWDKVLDYKDVSSSSLLSSLATQQAIARKAPKPTYKVTYKSDQIPQFGDWALGDACYLVIVDPRHPYPGVKRQTRIIRWELRPPSGDSVEETNLMFEGDDDA